MPVFIWGSGSIGQGMNRKWREVETAEAEVGSKKEEGGEDEVDER